LQATVMTSTNTIDIETLGMGAMLAGTSSADEAATVAASARVESLGDHKTEEKQRILDALQACGWNRAKAAQVLGMPRRTFYRRLTDYAILA
jgi:serine/threonine-protein kinase PknK